MKKRLKAVSCVLVVMVLFSITAYNPTLGPFGVDVVSAATAGAETPAPAPTKPAPAPAPAKPAPAPTPTKPAPAPAQATPVASEIGTRILLIGSSGADVKLLQTTLNNEGHDLKIDGFFGVKTFNAVKSYQSKNGLWADGIVGPKTKAKLFTVVATVPAPVVGPGPAVDVVSTASIVNTKEAFLNAISKNGTWIAAMLNDLAFDQDLVLEGEFTNKDKVDRKIALYTQDADRNVVDSFTLTAPKLTIKSPNARIQNGTFKGNLYVSAPNVQLRGAKIVGNVYFTTQEAKDTFKMDDKSSISGSQILADVDAVSTASIVRDAEAFEKALGTDGAWIICPLNDLTIDKDLVVEGEFRKKDLPENELYRKIGLYTHNDPSDKKIVTHRFTLTAPSLTIKSPNTSLQHGIFIGDIYVRSAGFALVDQKVEGNVYFVTQEAKDTFTMDEASSITGKQILADVDVVATASLVHDVDAFEKAIGKDGAWIICPLRDLTTDNELVVEGDFRKKDLPENELYRKIGLYTHNDPSDKKIVTHRFTLTAPLLTIKSPNTSLQHGIFVGDIYVASTGFALADQKVEGNIYFSTQEALDTFTMDEASSVSGVKELKTN